MPITPTSTSTQHGHGLVPPNIVYSPPPGSTHSGAGGAARPTGGSMSKKSQTELDAEAEAKRRKVQRACDVCRRKKIRCEGPMTSASDAKCANCEECGYECTYVEQAKRRGPPKGYIETLEQRCGRLEKVLQQLHPYMDLNATVGPPLDKDDFDLNEYNDTLRNLLIPPYPAVKQVALPQAVTHTSTLSENSAGFVSASVSPPAAPAPSPASRILGPAPWSTYQQDPNRPSEDDEQDDNDARVSEAIAEAMSKLEVKDVSWRFHGKASGAHLMRVISDLKYGQNSPHLLDLVSRNKRNEYWKIPEWEIVIAQEGVHPIDYSTWPEPSLDRALIDAYFTHVNQYLPLLNKVVFDRQYDTGLYRSNQEFAKICWMVFANGARFVDDERVYWPVDLATSQEGRERLMTDADGTRRYSAGWKYIRAVIRMGRSIAASPSLYDFQTQVLVCAFLTGSAIPHMAWLLSGFGLRSAQELGIHVRTTLLNADPTERALYNRAFWCLYHIDRLNCAAVGRSVALQDTDFDADYPIAVDDEYWETGDRARDFAQPLEAGLPSVSAFIHMLKLDHVIGAALRTIYAVNKSPEHRADPAAQREVVVELDSALNSWADAVPDGLRWDPSRSDQQLFQQSAVLYAQYYYCQILIHRPFIPTPRNPANIGLPSLAICSNASRSICNILDAALRRGRQYGLLPGRILDASLILPAWVAAVILLISVHAGRLAATEKERTVNDIRKCLAALKDMELTWRQAGKMTDLLTELLRPYDPADFPPTTSGPGKQLMNNDPFPHGQKRSLQVEPPVRDLCSGIASAGSYGPGPHSQAHSHSQLQDGYSHSTDSNHGQHGEPATAADHIGQTQPQAQGATHPPQAAPPTPPFLWGWGNGTSGSGLGVGSGSGSGTGPIFPGMAPPLGSSAGAGAGGGGAGSNNGIDMMNMDSFFNDAVFGGLRPDMDMNGNLNVNGGGGGGGGSAGSATAYDAGAGYGAGGGEEDLWQQLFGTYQTPWQGQ